MDDAAIVERVRGGEREAYGELVERYQNAAYGLAYHYLKDFEDARDAAQEALVHAYVRLEQLQDGAKFGAWLRQITANTCRMQQRRRMAERSAELTDIAQEGMPAAATDHARQWDTRLMVQDALGCLSEASQLTVILYYFHAYSLPEIAAFLEVPVSTIKSRLRNARARLHKELMQVVEDALQQAPLPADFKTRVMHNLTSSGAVHTVAIAPDGTLLANDSSTVILNDDGETQRRLLGAIEIWDIAGGTLRHTLQTAEQSPLESVAFAPDGVRLACSSFDPAPNDGDGWVGAVLMWDAVQGQLLRRWTVPGGIIRAVAFAPDGNSIAGGINYPQGDGEWRAEVRVWPCDGGDACRVADIACGMVFSGSLRFSPDGSFLAIGTGCPGDVIPGSRHRAWIDCRIELRDVATGELRHSLERGHGGAQTDIAFSPDGRLVAAGDGPEGDVLVWEVATGRLQRRLQGHQHRVYAVAFAPDGRTIASGSHDKTVRLWKLDDAATCRTLEAHAAGVHALAFTPDAAVLVSADVERGVKVWAR